MWEPVGLADLFNPPKPWELPEPKPSFIRNLMASKSHLYVGKTGRKATMTEAERREKERIRKVNNRAKWARRVTSGL